jgi:class 3 adenylate cyclase
MTVRQRSSWLHPAASALRGLPWMTGRRERGPVPKPADPEYRSIVVIDMAGSGRWDDRAQLRARAALDEMVRGAFRAAGIAWHTLVVEYRGDGMIILVPAAVSKVDIFDPVVTSLSAALGKHNSITAPQIRLRVAVHAGEVLRGRFGWVGADLNLTCRLVDSQPLYRELTRCPQAHLVLVVSEMIHQAVVRHGHRSIDPSGYTPVHVAVKEVKTRAWMHTPGTMTTSRWRRRAQRFR